MIGSAEFAVIAVLALLFFGPEKLPEFARSLGKAVAEYRRAAEELEDYMQEELSVFENEAENIARDLNISTENRHISNVSNKINKEK